MTGSGGVRQDAARAARWPPSCSSSSRAASGSWNSRAWPTQRHGVGSRWPRWGRITIAGLQPVEQLIAALADEPTLLVLDNCEHLLEPCAALAAALLAQHAAVTRDLRRRGEPLGVPGEVTWRVALAVGAAARDGRCGLAARAVRRSPTVHRPSPPGAPDLCGVRRKRTGHRADLLSARRHTARAGVGGRALPADVGGANRDGARRSVPSPDRRCAHRARLDNRRSRRSGRLELRPAGRDRASPVPSTRRVRRELPDGRGRARRGGPRRRRPGDGVRRAEPAGRQEPGHHRGATRRRAALPPARDATGLRDRASPCRR